MKVTEKRFRELVSEVILSESRYYGMSIQDVLAYLNEFSNHQWIFLDLETTGLNNPLELSQGQLLEIAAIAVNPNDWEGEPSVVGVFNRKVELSNRTKQREAKDAADTAALEQLIADLKERVASLQKACEEANISEEDDEEVGDEDPCEALSAVEQELQEAEKKEKKRKKYWTIPDVLQYTSYREIPDRWDTETEGVLEVDDQWDQSYIDEQQAINEFFAFVDQYENPVIVIQNAEFDSEWIGARFMRKADRYPVIDTLRINRLFLTPMLKTLAAQGDQAAINFLDESGGRSGLANISKGFGLSVEGHHTAIIDVKMTLMMLSHAIRKLKENPDLNIEAEHGEAIFGREVTDDEGNVVRDEEGKIKRKGGEIKSAAGSKARRKWWSKKYHSRAQRRKRLKRKRRREEEAAQRLTQQQITQAAIAKQGQPSQEMEDEFEAMLWRQGAKPTTVSEDVKTQISREELLEMIYEELSRGDVVFPAESSKVKDDKDHFPINNLKQARNALARASQYSKVPGWYDGSLTDLVKTVQRKVKSKYSSIKTTDASATPRKG